jgi:hypothetical protein
MLDGDLALDAAGLVDADPRAAVGGTAAGGPRG